MSLSNYPPGVTDSMLPGANDRDVSYTADVLLCNVVDNYDEVQNDIKGIVTLLESEFNVEVDMPSLDIKVGDILKTTVDDFNYTIVLHLEADTCIDMSYMDVDSWDIETEIMKDIKEKLDAIEKCDKSCIFYSDYIIVNKYDISYEVN